ncbi:MAG: glycosyltransferase family 4 protein, partial [Candidatus Omnitrophota bacterium]
VVTIHDITFGVCRPRPDGFSKAGLKRFLRKYARFLIMKFRILVFKKYLLGTLRIPDHLIVHLSKTKAGLEKLGIGQDKISVIRLGNPRAAKSREHGFETDTKLLTIFGFIVPTKGYDIALRAIKALGRDDIHLVIGGGIRTVHDKAYYETLVKLIDASGIKVTLTHYLNKEEAFALLRRSTAILLPFRDTGTEVGSYSLSYAIAAEKPIIASDIPFFSEIAEHSKCITLFKEGDAGDLALTIDRVLGNVPYYEKLTRDYAGINSWNELSQKTISIYEKVRPLPPDCRS